MFVSLVFSVIVSEPRAVATGSGDTLENVRCSTQLRLDPVATARGSDTRRHRGSQPCIGKCFFPTYSPAG
jgi:hypothetical protein